MTSDEVNLMAKRSGDTPKKSSPLKVVSPIIKKYSGQRQGRIKKLDFPRRLQKVKNQHESRPPLKSILPKTVAGDVIVLESELIPCALNIQGKEKREESEGLEEFSKSVIISENECENKHVIPPLLKDTSLKVNKSRLNVPAKRRKYMKNIEATFDLFKSKLDALKEEHEQTFVENYFQRVQEKLKGKDDTLYVQFINLISEFQKCGMSVVDLFKKVREMFSQHTELSDDFVAFLTPQQAVSCGVFLEHLLLTTMSDFLHMIDKYFSKSPLQVRKIHSVLEKLLLKENVTAEDVTNSILPLLKGNAVLQDYFMRLMPQSAPPENFLLDFEEIECPDLNSDVSEDEDHFEIVKVPDVEDVFGSDSCPCGCHNSEDQKYNMRIVHCTSCSVKFINGKIFIQNGKLLRPAKVTFDDHDAAYHMDRLAPKRYPTMGRKKCRPGIFKDNLSPTKSCYLSSDEFKSDIEDDDKMKSKLGMCKSPRGAMKKIASPKSGDRSVARCILSDSKCEHGETEEKTCGHATRGGCPEMDVKREINADKSVGGRHSPNDTLFDAKAQAEEAETLGDVTCPKEEVMEVVEEEEKTFVDRSSVPPHAAESSSEVKTLPTLLEKEGSKSPPVISIPESENPPQFLLSSKPIFSLIENLDESMEPVLSLLSDSDNSLKLDDNRVGSKSSGASDPSAADCSRLKEDREDKLAESEGAMDDDGEEEVGKDRPWKIEEDRIILQTLQVEENCDETFRRINEKMPSRSLVRIKERFANLMNMLYEMKANTIKNEDK